MNGVEIPHSPVLKPDPAKPGWWKLDEPYTVRIWPHVYDVHRGFQTDGASIPRAFWRVTGHPFDPQLIYGAIIHDAAYRHALYTDGALLAVKREKADALFLKIMTGCTVGVRGGIDVSVGWWRRSIVYRAVRMFGGWSYKGEST